MTFLNPPPVVAARRSAEARQRRAALHNHVLNGGSLTLLLRDPPAELGNVRIGRMVRWIPNVGPHRARRILLGLPSQERLGMLSRWQRIVLTRRVADAERQLLALYLYGRRN